VIKMNRLLMLMLPLAVGLALPAQSGEMIDGYEVVSPEDSGIAQEVTEIGTGLGRLVDLGPLELGAVEEDHLVLKLWFRLVDAVPIKGKVHKIRFEELQLNEVAFSIPQIDAFEIPSHPPYEVDDPITIKAAYDDIEINMLQAMLSPEYTFQLTGRMMVFGKFKINRRNKKYVVPVEINVELDADTFAESEYRDEVANQIFTIIKSDFLEKLEQWKADITTAEGAEAVEPAESTEEEAPQE